MTTTILETATETTREWTEAERAELDASILAAEMAAGLRGIADMLVATPALARMFENPLKWAGIWLHPARDDSARGDLARFVRAALAVGAVITKEVSDDRFNVTATLPSGVKLMTLSHRDEVCERVVTGVETVTRTVPDPTVEIPMVEVTEQVETVRWECKPLLAAGVS